VSAFIEEFNRQDDRQVHSMAPDAERQLERYSWPGNVRELRNVVQRAVALRGTGRIDTEHLPNTIRRVEPPPAAPKGASIMPIRELERRAILRALEETQHSKRRAARLLGISLKTLYNKLAKYGVPLESVRRSSL
jgi:two-component system, NtrC family, response regulator AtoC